MSNAIQVSHLGKRYELGRLRDADDTLAGAALRLVREPSRLFHRTQPEVLAALDNVTFDVKWGEVVGLIGHNGAGKSTLLKIIARITAPSEGTIELFGRVGSLLEVGTGFHADLSGRENIYLNGSILGMTREQIKQRFDDIVEFAELGPFIDTPVKRYSSGMYVRLGFSVAAFLEPEILIVDEVLSVGDASFVQKCLGRLDDMVQGGRTVLFVSHNMAAIQRLCGRAILMHHGNVVADGPPPKVVDQYLAGLGSEALSWEADETITGDAMFLRVAAIDGRGRPLQVVTTATKLRVALDFEIRRLRRDLRLSVALTDTYGEIVFGSAPGDDGMNTPIKPGRYRAIVEMPPGVLLNKSYGIISSLWSVSEGGIHSVDAIRFSAEATDSLGTKVDPNRPGSIALQCKWTVTEVAVPDAGRRQ